MTSEEHQLHNVRDVVITSPCIHGSLSGSSRANGCDVCMFVSSGMVGWFCLCVCVVSVWMAILSHFVVEYFKTGIEII